MFFFNKGTQVLVDKCYNRQCKSLCTCISQFGIIGICLVLLTETIYIFLSEKYREIAFSGWAATILYCFICLSNLSNAQCSYLLHFSTTIGSQRQAKNAENSSSTLLITEVLDYCVAAMVDATTHSSSCLFPRKKKHLFTISTSWTTATSANLELLNDSYISLANRRFWYYGHAKQRLSETS